MSEGYVVRNLGVRVGDRAIVEDISFSLAPGEIVALAGASGAGKSMSAMTPFGLSAGLASGSAMLDGIELVGMPERELSRIRAEKVGFVFQQPLTALTPHRTVGQHLKEAAMQAGGVKPDKAAMVAMLESVGLSRPEERLVQYPHRLSGGERQRVLIAAAALSGDAGPNGWIAKGAGVAAVTLASVNIFGGFMVTRRMLAMYRKKEKPKAEAKSA